MLTTLLAMIGTGLAFAANADQRTQAKGTVPSPRKDPRVLRELQTQGSNAALSSVAASVASEADAAREKRPKENPANFKVDGYRFSDLTPQEPKFQPLPSSVTAEAPDSEEPMFPPGFTVEPDPSNFKVPGYRFKSTPLPNSQPVSHDDSSPHPEGVFNFNSGTARQIQMGSGQQQPGISPTTPVTGDIRPHPSQNFTFGQSTQDLIRAGGIPPRAPPLPVVDPISSPSFSNNIDVVAESNGYTINEPLSDGRVGSWLVGKDDREDPSVSVPVMAGKGGSNYLETLAPPGGRGNIRP